MSRRNPFDELERMFDRMSDQFGQFDPETALAGNVAVDVADRGGEYVVRADLPGYDRENIDVEYADGTLSIAADREAESETEGETETGTYLRRERSRSRVSRSIRLPDDVRPEDTTATYEDGVLTVTLPKREGDDQRGTDIPVN